MCRTHHKNNSIIKFVIKRAHDSKSYEFEAASPQEAGKYLYLFFFFFFLIYYYFLNVLINIIKKKKIYIYIYFKIFNFFLNK